MERWWLMLMAMLMGCAPVAAEQGPAGERGDVGERGPRGATGERGPSGVDGASCTPPTRYTAEYTAWIETGSVGYLEAECDSPDHLLVSGGCESSTPLLASHPARGSHNGGAKPRWVCASAASDGDNSLTAFAVCDESD